MSYNNAKARYNGPFPTLEPLSRLRRFRRLHRSADAGPDLGVRSAPSRVPLQAVVLTPSEMPLARWRAW